MGNMSAGLLIERAVALHAQHCSHFRCNEVRKQTIATAQVGHRIVRGQLQSRNDTFYDQANLALADRFPRTVLPT